MHALCIAALALVPAQTDSAVSAQPVKWGEGRSATQGWEFTPPGRRPWPAMVLVHGDFGPNDWVKDQARRLAGKGYLVLIPDLYSGELPKNVEEAHILERGLEEGKVHAQLKAALDYVGKRPQVRAGALGIIGFDSGGGYALDLAIQDARLRAAVNCYGRLTTDPAQLARIKAPLLCLFGGKDDGLPSDTIEQFDRALKKARCPATIKVYADSPTCFLDPASPYHEARSDAAVIADAWRLIEAHLEKSLR